MNFFILIEDTEYGPYSKEELSEFLKTQRANINTPTREESSKIFRNLYEVLGEKNFDIKSSDSENNKVISSRFSINNISIVLILFIVILIGFFAITFINFNQSISQLEQSVKTTASEISKISNDDFLDQKYQIEKQNERIESLNNDILMLKKEVKDFKDSYGRSFDSIDMWKKDLLNDFNKKLTDSANSSSDLIRNYRDELNLLKNTRINLDEHSKQSDAFKKNLSDVLKKYQLIEKRLDTNFTIYDKTISDINSRLDLISTSLKSMLQNQENSFRKR